jgi:hypothetical protein
MWRNFSVQMNSNRWPNLILRSSRHILSTTRERNWVLLRRLDFHCTRARVTDEGYSKLLVRCEPKFQKKVNQRCLFGTAEVFVWARWHGLLTGLFGTAEVFDLARWHGLRTVGSTIMLIWDAEAWLMLYVGLPNREIWRLALPELASCTAGGAYTPCKEHCMMLGIPRSNHAVICTCLWSQFCS